MVSKFSDIIRDSQNNTFLLQKKLINMLREYFSLRMQLKIGQLKKLHLLKKSRYDIAFLKFYLSQKKSVDKKRI